MKLPQRRLYIALEGFDFGWNPELVYAVAKDYRAGVSVPDMVEKYKRHPVEVAVLIMDLAERRVIEPRPSGVWGFEKEVPGTTIRRGKQARNEARAS